MTDLGQMRENLLTCFNERLRDYVTSMLKEKILDAVAADKFEVRGCALIRSRRLLTWHAAEPADPAIRNAEPGRHEKAPRCAPGSWPPGCTAQRARPRIATRDHLTAPPPSPPTPPRPCALVVTASLSKPYYTTNQWEALDGLLNMQRLGFSYDQLFRLVRHVPQEELPRVRGRQAGRERTQPHPVPVSHLPSSWRWRTSCA